MAFTSARKVKWTNPVWVSTGRLERRPEGQPLSSRALRDALGALARVFFDRDLPVATMTRWDPTVTPQLLDAAARFGSEADLVSVFATGAQIKAGELSGADWRSARLFEAPAADQSRGEMLFVPARCAVLLGGGKEVDDDGAALLSQRGQPLPGAPPPYQLFAVASTGGAAARALAHARAAFGGNLPELELSEPTSYTVLMKRILMLTEPPSTRGHHSPGVDPSGHGWSQRSNRASQISEAVQ
jgi:hypothetical protein